MRCFVQHRLRPGSLLLLYTFRGHALLIVECQCIMDSLQVNAAQAFGPCFWSSWPEETASLQQLIRRKLLRSCRRLLELPLHSAGLFYRVLAEQQRQILSSCLAVVSRWVPHQTYYRSRAAAKLQLHTF
jgi:hypothetical protein